MIDDWERFLAPYYQTVKELKVKLRGIRKQFLDKNTHAPIEFVTGRVKPIDSILAKAELRGIAIDRLEEEMQDIAGLRIMCQFVDDIYEVARLIRTRNDMRVVQERDYVTNKKASGYRSYHIVIEFPVQLVTGEKKILAEIQIRTLAMNFWATIEHSLNYKYQGVFPEDLSARLKRAAEAAYQLDEEMSSIREEIQEAQHMFSHGRNDWHRPDEESDNELGDLSDDELRRLNAPHKAGIMIEAPAENGDAEASESLVKKSDAGKNFPAQKIDLHKNNLKGDDHD